MMNGSIPLMESKELVLLGATRDKIAETARAHGFEEIVMADTFEEAICKMCRECKTGRCSTPFSCMCKLGNV